VIYALVIIYFLPPIIAMFVAPQMEVFGRVWLFNLLSLFLWPVFLLLLPWRTY
jgi:hypothetical protein